MSIAPPAARTLGELREAGSVFRSLRDEVQANLRRHLREATPLFPGIRGFDDSVIPAVENALLSGHDMIFLGERGQAKTRLPLPDQTVVGDGTDDSGPSADAHGGT